MPTTYKKMKFKMKPSEKLINTNITTPLTNWTLKNSSPKGSKLPNYMITITDESKQEINREFIQARIKILERKRQLIQDEIKLLETLLK